VGGSGISWAICKSAPSSRQITMPAPHHSVFYRPDALPAAQPTASKHCCVKTTKMFLRKKNICFKTNSLLCVCLFLHPEAEKRNHFSFMNKSLNMQYSLTEFSTLIINEYYIIDVIYVISGIYSTFHRSPNCGLYFPQRM